MKDSEPVGEHLGKEEDVDESPGLVTFESNIMIFLKKLHVGFDMRKCMYWAKVYETHKKVGDQVVKQEWDKEAVDSLISELGLGSSEQGIVSVDACNRRKI